MNTSPLVTHVRKALAATAVALIAASCFSSVAASASSAGKEWKSSTQAKEWSVQAGKEWKVAPLGKEW